MFIRKKPNFAKTIKRLERYQQLDVSSLLHDLGKRGKVALSKATPVDTGETADSWHYTLERTKDSYRLVWKNTEMAGRVPLVILLQLGHGTRSGQWIPGRNFINPALEPLYRDFRQKLRREVKR